MKVTSVAFTCKPLLLVLSAFVFSAAPVLVHGFSNSIQSKAVASYDSGSLSQSKTEAQASRVGVGGAVDHNNNGVLPVPTESVEVVDEGDDERHLRATRAERKCRRYCLKALPRNRGKCMQGCLIKRDCKKRVCREYKGKDKKTCVKHCIKSENCEILCEKARKNAKCLRRCMKGVKPVEQPPCISDVCYQELTNLSPYLPLSLSLSRTHMCYCPVLFI